MLPDVVDAAYAETGVRREELFYSFFVFCTKCSSGLSLAISTGAYKLGTQLLRISSLIVHLYITLGLVVMISWHAINLGPFHCCSRY